MNIAYTVTPPQQPIEQEWMKEFKVGIQAPKFNDRAMDMMKQWGMPEVGPNFATTIAKFTKENSNFKLI